MVRATQYIIIIIIIPIIIIIIIIIMALPDPPVGVLLQALDGLLDVAHVPEAHLAVVPAAGQVVLPVGVEVQVSHQLPMGVLYAVDLTGERERERERERLFDTTS